MMDFITAPLIVFIVFAGIYGLFELFVRRRERMAIIEKLGDKFEPSMIEGKFSFGLFAGKQFPFATLRIGCLLIGIGLGFLIGFLICAETIPDYIQNSWPSSSISGIIYGACLFIFGGLGLLTAFCWEMNIKRKKQ